MPDYVLYQYPLRACSTVTVNALTEAGLEFEDRVIDIRAGEQNEAAYRSVHPYGKVPALSVDGTVIIENVAILLYIDAVKPNVLFPKAKSHLDRAAFHADLVWCTATMHPAIRQVRMPVRYTDGEVSGVRKRGLEVTREMLDVLEARLDGDRWWYGESWSIVDVYINWGLVTAASTGLLDLSPYRAVRAHSRRVRERPSFKAASARQTESKEQAGLTFPDEDTWNTNVI